MLILDSEHFYLNLAGLLATVIVGVFWMLLIVLTMDEFGKTISKMQERKKIDKLFATVEELRNDFS